MNEAEQSGAFLEEMVMLTLERAGQTRRNTKTVLFMEAAQEGVVALELEIVCKYIDKKDKPAQDFILMPEGTSEEEMQMIYDNACDVVRNVQTTNIGGIN